MGTTQGRDFIYMDFNRVIKKYRLDMIYISGSDKEKARLIISRAILDTIDALNHRRPSRSSQESPRMTPTRHYFGLTKVMSRTTVRNGTVP
ncbi:MAG: hypothetical protein ACM3TN_28765 [Alphaproteobacteria bacterium]